MRKPFLVLVAVVLVWAIFYFGQARVSPPDSPAGASPRIFAVRHTEEEWRGLLTGPQYDVLRGKGTERAFSGLFHDNHAEGSYFCAGCGQLLFRSSEKFDSGTGWPSYWQPADPQAVVEVPDNSFFMQRIEVVCANCGGHLGHVFRDGPRPTGLRYCINSVCLKFSPEGASPTPTAR